MSSAPGALVAATADRDGSYDEALERLHTTGPEFDGWPSNHGPMVVEVLSRRGAGARVHAWTDRYAARLDERPRGLDPLTTQTWPDALGDPRRSGDWLDFLLTEMGERPWQDTLGIWWPRLLPGIAAGATHGVIRVGHVVQALSEEVTTPRLSELAHALAYWAARWQPVPVTRAIGTRPAGAALDGIPGVPDPRGGIRDRLAQLPDTPGWTAAQAALDPGPDPAATLTAVVDAALAAYAVQAHGQPTMLVHAVTAPAAVARVLPSLSPALARPSVDAAWAATAAVFAAYRPRSPLPRSIPAPSAPTTRGSRHWLTEASTSSNSPTWPSCARHTRPAAPA